MTSGITFTQMLKQVCCSGEQVDFEGITLSTQGSTKTEPLLE